jgi:hypothetical protein
VLLKPSGARDPEADYLSSDNIFRGGWTIRTRSGRRNSTLRVKVNHVREFYAEVLFKLRSMRIPLGDCRLLLNPTLPHRGHSLVSALVFLDRRVSFFDAAFRSKWPNF